MKPIIEVPPSGAYIELELTVPELDFLTMAAQQNSMFATATRLASSRPKLEAGIARRYKGWLKAKVTTEAEPAAEEPPKPVDA